MSSRINKNRLLYLLLALMVGFRTLVVPGLTPVSDADSPLGFNIAFCVNLFDVSSAGVDQPHHDGHGHSHDNDNTPAEESGVIPLSNHCSVGFIGGIFIETYSFNVQQYLDQIKDQFKSGYTAPFVEPSHYRIQASRAPPISFII
jgi:hypothetical protein